MIFLNIGKFIERSSYLHTFLAILNSNKTFVLILKENVLSIIRKNFLKNSEKFKIPVNTCVTENCCGIKYFPRTVFHEILKGIQKATVFFL